jgi:proline dehydrogenase
MIPSVNSMMRQGILTLSHDRRIVGWVRRYGMRMGAGRFVAGETLDDCVRVLRRLTELGFATNTTLLGEAVGDAATAQAVANGYLTVLDRLAEEGLRTNLSVKLTHLGLDVSEDVAYAGVTRLLSCAAEHGQFVRIDMEDSARVDPTLRIYRRLQAEGHENVGTVLQAYLYRSEEDLRVLLPARPNLRFVKGAYLEPADVAFPKKGDVDRNFFRLIATSLLEGGYTAIATHDDRIIARSITFVNKHRIGRDKFEFQMLFGVRSQLQLDVLRQGYRVLIATPYGEDWYPYFMRRLAERPANVFFFVRNLVRR